MNQELKQYEQEHLKSLINRQAEASKAIQQCLIDILGLRGLDITKYGISADLTTIIELPSKSAVVPVPAPEPVSEPVSQSVAV